MSWNPFDRKTAAKINNRIDKLEKDLKQNMSAISDFTQKLKSFQDRQTADLAALAADIKVLNDKIAAFTPGALTAEDQAALDAVAAQSSKLADNADALVAANAAAPEVPPEQPAGPAA